MRARLFIVSSLAVAAVLGASSAAQAKPNGPGDIQYNPQPTTTTTQPPKGPDKVAPKPTTSTTVPAPKGPGDIANPQSDPVVDPGDTGNGSGSDLDYGTPADTSDGDVADTQPVSNVSPQIAGDNGPAATPAATDSPSNLPMIAIVLVAGVIGALLALFATRMRRSDDEHAEHV